MPSWSPDAPARVWRTVVIARIPDAPPQWTRRCLRRGRTLRRLWRARHAHTRASSFRHRRSMRRQSRLEPGPPTVARSRQHRDRLRHRHVHVEHRPQTQTQAPAQHSSDQPLPDHLSSPDPSFEAKAHQTDALFFGALRTPVHGPGGAQSNGAIGAPRTAPRNTRTPSSATVRPDRE